MTLLWLGLPAFLLLFIVAGLRRSRTQRLARMRNTWGLPIARLRRTDAMSRSHAARIAHLGRGHSLDDRTWVDLNLDDVFAVVDRTQSTLGQHALYHRLRTAPVADHLEAFEALVLRMTLDSATRERAQLAFARLQDLHGYDIWWLAGVDAVERRPWYLVFPVLSAIAIGLTGLAPFWPAALAPMVAALLFNAAVRYATDSRILTIALSLRQCAPLIATAESLRFLAGDDIDPIVNCLHTDVPSLARLKLISRWVSGDPFMLTINPDPLVVVVHDFVTAVYEYINLFFLLDATGVYFATRDLARHGGALVRVTAAAGDVDAAIGVASFRSGRSDWTSPDFQEPEASTELTDLRHPLVDNAVPNSIAVQAGRGVLITGSNMSGKSTFLRTVGVNAILAQTIATCLAREVPCAHFPCAQLHREGRRSADRQELLHRRSRIAPGTRSRERWADAALVLAR